MKSKDNLHLFFSDIVVESRLFKEASYTLQNSILDNVHVHGLWSAGLKDNEIHSSGIEIFRTKLLLNKYKDSFLSRFKLLRLILIFFGLIQYAIKSFLLIKRKKYEFISIHNVELLPLGVIFKFIYKMRLVYLPHELETQKSGKSKLYKLLTSAIEFFFIKFSDSVITVCPPITNWYLKKYNLSIMHTIRNVPPIEETYLHNNVTDFRNKFNIDRNEIIFIYQGLLASGRGLDILINSFKISQKNLILMGHGDIANYQLNSFKNIHYHKPVNLSDICSQTAMANVGIHVNDDNSLSYKFSLPNKFFEYMHAQIPIIVSSNMEYLSEIVVNNNLGWVIKPNEIYDLINSISHEDIKMKSDFIKEYSKHCTYEHDANILKEVYLIK